MYSILVCKANKLLESKIGAVNKLLKEKETTVWIDIEKPDEEDKKILLEVFDFHPLAIDDCAHFTHLPKVDDFGNYIFVVFHRIFFDEKTKSFKLVELDLFLGKNFIVTVHGGNSPGIEEVKEKVKKSCALMQKGPEYVLHEILEFNTQNYFPLLEHLDERIEALEERILKGNIKDAIREIITLKKQVYDLKRSLLPQRDVVNRLSRGEFPAIKEKASVYFRDIYDHIQRALTELDDFRELLTGAYEAHLSIMSNRMNEIMKKLTIVATIFIPLTFITGLYGMNFRFMPELEIWWAYPLVWGIMIAVAFAMLVYFKKKKWF